MLLFEECNLIVRKLCGDTVQFSVLLKLFKESKFRFDIAALPNFQEQPDVFEKF